MRPKRSLGQNFLTSVAARTAIVRAAQLGHDSQNPTEDSPPWVLEIGPGKGFLTEGLLAAGAQVIAVEKDDQLYAFLQEKFGQAIGAGRLKLIHGDILHFPSSLLPSNYKLIANIPYNLTREIIRRFLETENRPNLMVLMLQKEVAERIVGLPRAKSRDQIRESLLSISVKAFGEPKYIQTVRAGSFFPKPRVDSAILAIKNIRPARFDLDIVRVGFAHKRKLLKSNLNCSTEIFEKCKIDPQARAENLTLDQWICLNQQLNPFASGKSSD